MNGPDQNELQLQIQAIMREYELLLSQAVRRGVTVAAELAATQDRLGKAQARIAELEKPKDTKKDKGVKSDNAS